MKTNDDARRERFRDLVNAALASDATVEAGGATYRAKDVHAWMERLARGENPPRPAPYYR